MNTHYFNLKTRRRILSWLYGIFSLDGMIPYIKKEVDDLNEYMMAISLGEGIGLTATEVINENDQVVAIPLKESHHHADLCSRLSSR